MTPRKVSVPPFDASVWSPLLARRLAAGGRPVPDEAESLQRVLQQLAPEALTALEYPLVSSGEPELPDVSQRISTSDRAERLADQLNDLRVKDWLLTWANARRDEAGVLARLRSAWLEFDVRRSENPQPVVCLRLPHDCGPLGRWHGVLPADASGVRSETQRVRLEECAARLPPKSRPMYLFDLSARRDGEVRLELYGPPLASMTPYLEAIGAPVPRWFDRVGPLIEDADRFHLSFDLDGEGRIGDRIGVEASYARLPQRDDRWSALFARLEASGLCSPRVARCLPNWLGQDDPYQSDDLWPVHPSLARGRFVRLLSHVKLVGSSRGEPMAKVYYLFRFIEPRRW